MANYVLRWFFPIAFLRRCSEGDRLLTLFLTFLKINLLIDSGPASVGLHHEEAVGFGSVLPGSDTLQTAMFVGYSVAGVPGALAATFAATLPPTVLMLSVAILLDRLGKQPWLGGFVRGLLPAVVVILVLTAVKLAGLLGKAAPLGKSEWIAIGVVTIAVIFALSALKFTPLSTKISGLTLGSDLDLSQWVILAASAITLFIFRLDAVPVLIASAILGILFLS